MNSIKNTKIAAVLLSAFAATASAQGYSQPVREVEKEARLAVSGTCDAAINGPGGELSCQLTQVPAGKILAIRWISAHCQGPAGLNIVRGHAWAAAPITNEVYFPLQTVPAAAGKVAVVASTAVFMNVKSGLSVFFLAVAAPTAPGSACYVSYQGFLIDN